MLFKSVWLVCSYWYSRVLFVRVLMCYCQHVFQEVTHAEDYLCA